MSTGAVQDAHADDQVIVGVDGSEQASTAVRWATREAARRGTACASCTRGCGRSTASRSTPRRAHRPARACEQSRSRCWRTPPGPPARPTPGSRWTPSWWWGSPRPRCGAPRRPPVCWWWGTGGLAASAVCSWDPPACPPRPGRLPGRGGPGRRRPRCVRWRHRTCGRRGRRHRVRHGRGRGAVGCGRAGGPPTRTAAARARLDRAAAPSAPRGGATRRRPRRGSRPDGRSCAAPRKLSCGSTRPSPSGAASGPVGERRARRRVARGAAAGRGLERGRPAHRAGARIHHARGDPPRGLPGAGPPRR